MQKPIYTFVAKQVQECQVYTDDFDNIRFHLPEDKRYILIVDQSVYDLWKSRIDSVVGNQPQCLDMVVVPPGEQAKHYSEFLKTMMRVKCSSLNRHDMLIIIGGGACCDLGALVATTFMRGIPHILVPTTLLAMVDATHGGKSAVNLDQGKNLFGGFHTPQIVWMDYEFLKTLPMRDLKQAMAEVVKMAMIANNPDFFELIETFSQYGERAFERTDLLSEVVKISVVEKLKLVEPDWREHNLDRLLNLGHAVAHSLEAAYQFDSTTLGHGEAVAIGIAAKVRFSQAKGFLSHDHGSRSIALLECLGLPTSIKLSSQQYGQALNGLNVQKRIRDGNLRLVLPNTYYSSFIYHGDDAGDVMNYLE